MRVEDVLTTMVFMESHRMETLAVKREIAISSNSIPLHNDNSRWGVLKKQPYIDSLLVSIYLVY